MKKDEEKKFISDEDNLKILFELKKHFKENKKIEDWNDPDSAYFGGEG